MLGHAQQMPWVYRHPLDRVRNDVVQRHRRSMRRRRMRRHSMTRHSKRRRCTNHRRRSSSNQLRVQLVVLWMVTAPWQLLATRLLRCVVPLRPLALLLMRYAITLPGF